MSEKQQNEQQNTKKKRDPIAAKESQIARANATLENLIRLVEEYGAENRTSYEKDRQIRNIINSANTILYNETKNVYSIATELSMVRELIFNIQHVDGILESFNRKIERLTKQGSYDKIPEHLKNATDFSELLNSQIGNLNNLISTKMEEGFGSRRDLARFAKEKEDAEKERLNELKNSVIEAYRSGEFFSKLEDKLKGEISDESIEQLKNDNIDAFLDANKEKIFKALASKKDYAVVAEQFEVNMKNLYAFLNNVEKEAKVEKLLEDMKKNLYETIVNDLASNKTTVNKLNKIYPRSLVKKASTMLKAENKEEPASNEKAEETKTNEQAEEPTAGQ